MASAEKDRQAVWELDLERNLLLGARTGLGKV